MADTAVQSGSGNSPEPADQNRRDFIHIAAAVGAGGAAVSLAWPLVDQMNPAGDTLAMASIEYDVSKVGLGQEITIKRRGKPVFIRHRTPEEIAKARADDHADLRDPQTDAARVKPGHEDMLILVGVCTHLGCVPLFGQGEYNGWFCPCHGSVYDTSGRIRKGPAPKNLEVPDYSFLSPTRVKIG